MILNDLPCNKYCIMFTDDRYLMQMHSLWTLNASITTTEVEKGEEGKHNATNLINTQFLRLVAITQDSVSSGQKFYGSLAVILFW